MHNNPQQKGNLKKGMEKPKFQFQLITSSAYEEDKIHISKELFLENFY